MRKKNQKKRKLKYNTFNFEGLKGTTFEERLARVREVGKEAEKKFKTKYQNVNHWFAADYDQLYLLSFCMRYFLMHEEGYDEEFEKGSLSFAPHYLEILQAIALSHKRVLSAKPLWNDTEKLRNDMKEIGTLIQTKLLNLPDNIETQEEFRAYRIRTDVMGYFLAVRNWAYLHQMREVVNSMAALIRQEFKAIHNVDPVHFIDLLFAMQEKIENRINEHLRKVHSAISQKDYITIQEKYQEVFQTVPTTRENMEEMWKMAGKNLSNLRALFLAHSDIGLDRIFTFSIDEMLAITNETIEKDALGDLFDKLSFRFGDLADYPQEHIILNNPTHEKPFIKVGDEEYFTSLWTTIPHLSLSLLENLIVSDKALTERYSEYRAQYLESEIEKLFKASFPKAKIYRASKWRDADGKDYENDLLVLIDSFALVVEAKGGNITKPAKRGAPERLFKTIKALVEDPSTQALRFIEHLKHHRGEQVFSTNNATKNIINLDDIKYFIPLGVTFYHFGVVGANLKLLVGSGMTDKKIEELAPSISLTDLKVIFEILDTDSQKIHYLHRRREFEMQVDYFGDELDLLGFYLNNGFNLGDLENEKKLAIDLSINSKVLDPYFIAIGQGLKEVKPKLKMTKWWGDILSKLSERGTSRWIEFSYVLLNLNEWAQKELKKGFDRLVSRIKKKQVTEKHNWITFATPNDLRKYVVVAYPYLEEHRPERDEILSGILGEAFHEFPTAKGVVVIGVNIDANHYPYSVLAGDLSVLLFDDLFSKMSKQ